MENPDEMGFEETPDKKEVPEQNFAHFKKKLKREKADGRAMS